MRGSLVCCIFPGRPVDRVSRPLTARAQTQHLTPTSGHRPAPTRKGELLWAWSGALITKPQGARAGSYLHLPVQTQVSVTASPLAGEFDAAGLFGRYRVGVPLADAAAHHFAAFCLTPVPHAGWADAP